jgi:hypothetical protein
VRRCDEVAAVLGISAMVSELAAKVALSIRNEVPGPASATITPEIARPPGSLASSTRPRLLAEREIDNTANTSATLERAPPAPEAVWPARYKANARSLRSSPSPICPAA